MDKIIVGARLQSFSEKESLGVVNDTLYFNCFWPKLDYPVPLFAEGSSGIKVIGNTPRNVVFPEDTTFPEYYPDALYPAEKALRSAFPQVKSMINLTEDQVDVYMNAYNNAVSLLPVTAAKFTSRGDCHFLIHKELVENKYEEYVSELTDQQVLDIIDEKTTVKDIKLVSDFVKINDSSFNDNPLVDVYKVSEVDGKEVISKKI